MNQSESGRIRILLLLMAFILAALICGEFAMADSIWNRSAGTPTSLYSTTKAVYRIGDIVTILIVEETSATNDTSTSTDKETDLSMDFDGFDDILGLTHVFGRPLSADPRFEVDAESEFDGDGSSERSFEITGTVSGQVTEVLSNGNLRIEASQAVKINEEKNSVILVGTIRPQDISPQNTILSTQIANSEINYAGRGPLSTVQKRGVVTEFLEFIWPF
ncbi:MAG: flagellar basal body L-ring protein FlgH [Candidatus Lindowbacteria bacterium]|nr:flagellar basal body L-ring protein FlgH [Candidatus Lindowbacteria bacterium]